MPAALPQNVSNDLVRKQRENNINEMKKILKWNDKHTYDKEAGHDGITNHLAFDSFEDIPRYLKRTSKRASNTSDDIAWAGLMLKYKTIVGQLVFFNRKFIIFFFGVKNDSIVRLKRKLLSF